MTFEELFRAYWWLIFPIFGMFMAIWGMFSSERRARDVISLIRSYTDQGKEPPPELLKLALQEEAARGVASPDRRRSDAWTFVVFAALAAGFTTGWWWVRGEDFAFAFLIVAVTMGVLALGSLLILIFGRK